MNFILVDLDKLKKNILSVKKCSNYSFYIGDASLNAYAYGIKAIEVLSKYCNYLAVLDINEALRVRKFNKSIPILILMPTNLENINIAIENNLTITISDLEYVRKLNKIKLNNKLKVHLKIDTGLNDLGIKDKVKVEFAYYLLKNNPNIYIEGLYTEFKSDKQKDKFYELTSLICLKEIPIIYIIGSSLKLDQVNSLYIGSYIYGLNNLQANLEPIIKMYAKIIQIKFVLKKERIGLNSNYIAPHDMYIAIASIGYQNGIGHICGKRYVIIKKKRFKVIDISATNMWIEIDETISESDPITIIGKELTLSYLSKINKCDCLEMSLNLGKNNNIVYNSEVGGLYDDKRMDEKEN